MCVWRGIPPTPLMKRIKTKTISSDPLHDCLSLLYRALQCSFLNIFCSFHSYCSLEPVKCMFHVSFRPYSPATQGSLLNLISFVYISPIGVNQYLYSFISFTCKLRNSLPSSLFPTFLQLDLFKTTRLAILCYLLNFS